MNCFIALVSLLSMIFGYDECDIVFAGDAMMHSAQIDHARRSGGTYDFSGCFDAVAGFVSEADYAVVNLETPVSQPPYSGYPQFNAPSQYLDALAKAGFDLFLTANNHTLDRRDYGLCNTIDSLESRNLSHIGTYKNDSCRKAALPFVRNINGINVGFVNYTYGTNGIEPRTAIVDYIDRDIIRRDIASTRDAGAEFIFVCIHWGDEYKLSPNRHQTDLAEFIFSAGADAIIGGHPHVVQPIEMHDGHLLVYSLGNFISNMKTTDTRGGAMVKVTLARDETGNVRLTGHTYRLVFTEPDSFRLQWADKSNDPRAAAFAARAVEAIGKIGQ